MQSVLGRAVLFCLFALTAVALLSTSAFAGVTRETVYCGDNDNPCDGPNNFGFQNQSSVLVEHSLNEVGEFVWIGDHLGTTGRIWSREPLGGTGPNDYTSISGSISEGDPAGDWGTSIRGLAYDPSLNVLFFSDSNKNRILAFHRGEPHEEGDNIDYYSAAQSPEPLTDDGAAPGGSDAGMFNSYYGVGAMAWSTYNDRLYVIDAGNARIQIFSYDWGDGDANPAHLIYRGEITDDWNTDSYLPEDVAVDQTDGHVFVADGAQDTVREFDADGNWLEDVGDGESDSNPYTRDVAVDSPNHLLYSVKEGSIDVYSLLTDNWLGSYPSENFRTDSENSIYDIDLDPVSHSLYVVLGTSGADAADDNPPVAAYSLSPPATCTTVPAITVNAGHSVTIPTNCTDPEGDVVQEFHRDTPPASGSITPNANRTALTFNAGPTTATVQARYRVLTKNGLSPVYSQTYNVVGPASNEVPVVRKTANLSLSGGNVFVKLPGSDKFVPLTADMLIPLGTVIDARDGKAHLTFANADGTLYDGIFWDGIFQVVQGSGDKPIATLKLRDDLVGRATASIASAVATPAGFKAWTSRKRGKKKNGLWGDAHGKFKTSGKGGAATVRGTRWYVADYTFGSLFKVQRGVVVIDPIRGKNFNLKAGKQFFIFYKRK